MEHHGRGHHRSRQSRPSQPIRSRHTGESVHDIYNRLPGHITEREHFAGKRDTTAIGGNHTIGVNITVFDLYFIDRFFGFGNFHESSVTDTFLYNIICRICGRFEFVHGHIPGQAVGIGAVFGDCECVYGQRLNHIGASVALSQELEHTFIYSA